MSHGFSRIWSLPNVFQPCFVVFFPKFENSPPKIAPKNFVICWFDDILLILIRGFAWFQVDLAFPQVSPSFLHKIRQILPPKSSNSAHKRVWKSRFRSGIVGPDIRVPGRTSGSWRAKSRAVLDIRPRKSGLHPGCPTPGISATRVSPFCP